MDKGFEKAGSDNLPLVDGGMVADFFVSNPNFYSAEIKNVKAKRATKETYGDNAVGYVQLKKEGNKCTVKGKITPEHKVRSKPYDVEVVLDTKEEKVLICECKDCAASAGGCKHGVAFLLWLHRRSEEPSVTSVDCYWKKSALALIGNHKMDLASVFGKEVLPLQLKNPQFVEELVRNVSKRTGGVFDMCGDGESKEISIHNLMILYKKYVPDNEHNAEIFLEYVATKLTDELCKEVEILTKNQSKSSDWYEFRFGRITASKFYEAAKCKTLSGSLTEALVGAAQVIETEAILRGKRLESFVIDQVSTQKQISIIQCGLFLNKKFPIFGASPDGISSEYCIEVKCPAAERSITRYVHDGKIQPKYYHQLQLQMFLAEKEKGLFCVASPKFETNKEVQIFKITRDKDNVLDIMNSAVNFWKNAIYPILIKM